MADNIKIPYNDVFFYGLSMKSRDVSDVRGDIYSNILMKYLTSLKPVTNRLYRSADNAKYEYSYSFVPTKPISWRVIKNRRVVEDIEQLSDGKYCLNYYDDNGKDVKRVIFNNHHKWVKTNYYNSVYGKSLVCSVVPKEVDGETVILQYVSGDLYPVTLYCCPLASNAEVMQSVIDRVPEPEVLALTNYGLMYFACEETLKIYKQVLEEEELIYAEAHKPQVFNTEEDVAGGFCFDASNFDSTKNSESLFDLQSADELTDDGFASEFLEDDEIVVIDDVKAAETDEADEIDTIHAIDEVLEVTDDSTSVDDVTIGVEVNSDTEFVEPVYSVEKEISEAIRIITETTNLDIDEDFIFADTKVEESKVITEEPVVDSVPEVIVDESEGIELIEDILLNRPPVVESSAEVYNVNEPADALELLSMDDSAIDDYVSTLIDSILMEAQTTATEFMLDRAEEFTEVTDEVSESVAVPELIISNDYISENEPDAVIESNGNEYFYYGDVDDNNKRFGRGRTLMADGKTAYEGEYLDDMRSGVGSFYYKDGSLCYWGNWNENQRNGFGVGISSETGVSHIGTWQNNKPVGIGVRFDRNGNFMYLDSASHKTNGGIRVTGFTENSLIVEFWDENSLKVIKKEISVEDLMK